MIGPLLVDIARELGVSVGRAGLLAAATALPQALAAPLSGLLSDRLGRRPMIVLSLVTVGVLNIAAALAGSFGALVVTRFATGLLGSLAPTSLMAAVGDLFPERRARAMGWFNLGFSFAAIGGVPLMGALGGALGWRAAFAGMGVVLLLLGLAVRLWFPAVPPIAAGTSVLATYRAVWKVPGLGSLLGANLMERSLFGTVTIYLPAFLIVSHGMTAVTVAPALVVVAIGAMSGTVLGGRLGDRVPGPGIFVVAQLAAGLLGLALFGTPLALQVAVGLAALLTFANSASRPGILAYGAGLAPAQRGALLGLVAMTNQGGLMLGSMLGAAVIGAGSYRMLAPISAGLGVLAAGLALPLARAARRPRP